MTPGVPGILPEVVQGQECLEIQGAEELRDIPDRKVAGAGEEQLGPLCF